ncbi:MAG: TldD/PmbA family protein [Candidatus Pelagibacterales bacterium]|nr:MAG: TldD/PmbA family protein [Pelagibacterales bacterium]|tara:strand:+ start:434 stop:1759 length:1326 start_codon:yes stop_codon:yes gene_type:complete
MLKNKKFLEEHASYCVDRLINKLGATDCEVVVANSVSETVEYRNHKIESSDRSDTLAIGITSYIGKRKSGTTLSYIDKENTDKMLAKVIEVTKITPEDQFNELPDKELLIKDYEDLSIFDETEIDNQEKIKYLKEVEDEALSNEGIIKTNGSSFSQSKTNFILQNSLGLSAGYKQSSFSYYTDLLAKKNGSGTERDYEYDSKAFVNELMKPKELGKTAAQRAIRKLNPKKTKTQSIPIVFEPRIANSLLSTLSSAISGSSFARGTSFLKEKLNQKIFSKDINIIDDPRIKKSMYSKPFDDEGVSSEKIYLVKDGILKNLKLDSYYSKMLNMKSNGRSSGLTNTYFSNGKKSYKELSKNLDKYILVTETMGGFGNTTTGEFSCGAAGVYFENGDNYSINNFTLAGKLDDIFKNLILADDLKFKYSKNSPTAFINEGLVVGGQ